MNPSLDELRLKTVKVRGTIDVKKIKLEDEWETANRYIVLLMGPTGAGKSSFIESFAGPNSSLPKLSSGRLEGYTQDVAAYTVQGVKASHWHADPQAKDCNVYLIDTPGFADDRISALEIVSKVQKFMSKISLHEDWKLYIPYILYFTPITSTRVPGSQRSVHQIFKALTRPRSSGGITIVTTMWDTLWGEQAEMRAERNLAQLSSDIWKDLTDESAKITKFHNTCASALQILDLAIERNRDSNFSIEDAISNRTEPAQAAFGQAMYTDLVERIQALRMRKDIVLADLADPSIADNKELMAILNSDLSQVTDTLTKFEEQLRDFERQKSHLNVASTASSDIEDLPSPEYLPGPSQALPSPDAHMPLALGKGPGRLSRIKASTKRLVAKITH